MLTKEEIGKRIRELRAKHNKSQEEVGTALDKSHAAISDIERGKTNLTVTDLTAIAKFFGVSVSDILAEEELQQPIISTTHYRDAKDMTKEEYQMANKVAKEFIKYARELAENKKRSGSHGATEASSLTGVTGSVGPTEPLESIGSAGAARTDMSTGTTDRDEGK